MILESLERRDPGSAVLLQNGRATTVSELVSQARALAGALVARNVSEGDRVALLLPNCKELLVGLAACARIGAIAAPLDPAWTSPEIARALQPLAPRCVFILGRHAAPLRAALASLELSPPLVVRIDRELEGPIPAAEAVVHVQELVEQGIPAPDRRPERAAFIAHAAWRGRGKPHFAVRSADAVLEGSVLAARATGLVASAEEGRPILAAAPFFRPGALELSVLAPAILGTPFVVLKQLRARMALKLALAHGVRVVIAPPALLALMARLVACGAEPPVDNVRLWIAAAAPPPDPELAETIERTFQAPLVWGYGSAEMPWALAVSERALSPRLRGLGEPVGDCEVALGEHGAVHVRSRRAANEFLGELPEDLPSPLGVRTGDHAVRAPDGRLALLPRGDVATVAAYEVDLAEVAAAIEKHPSVALCSTFAVPDAETGMHVGAAVTLAPGAEASVAALVDFLRDRLAYYKIPQSFRFRRLDRPA